MTGDNGESGGAPAAGWYPDPTNPGHERLWTGERWIAWIRPNRLDPTEANPAGWREDAGRAGFERLWSGEMWTEETRRTGEVGPPSPGGPRPEDAALATPAVRPPPTASGRRGGEYHDDLPPDKLHRLSVWVCLAVAAVIAADVAEIVPNQIYIGILNKLTHGKVPGLGHLESVISAVHTTQVIDACVTVVTAVTFIVWFYRAYRNLIRTGIHDVRYGPGWAIGGWLIPLFNFVRPKQVANDIWKASASAATVGVERRNELRLPAILNIWWGLWILAGVLVAAGNGAINNANAQKVLTESSLHSERTGFWFDQAGLAVQIVAGILLILLVRQISSWQDEHFKASSERPGFGAATAVAEQPGGAEAFLAANDGVAAPPPTGTGTEATKTCPDCAEQVKAAARVCRFCGYRFDGSG